MAQQDCPSESEILDLAEGRLASEPRQKVLAHLDGCDECRQIVAALAPEIAGQGTKRTEDAANSEPPEPRSFEREMRPGRVVAGRYRIERFIGAGGMGAVFAAHHVDLDKSVALKLVRSDRGVDEEAVSRLLREAKAAAALDSEHVVAVLDAGRLAETGDAFVVYEYLEGEDLARALTARGPLDISFAADLILGACEALAVAHARGIVHRDIKPANLFLTERADGSPLLKVLDFGIAKVGWSDGAMTSRRAILGSPRYMAPEQLKSSATVDSRADVWSLGVTLFELVSGEAPFRGDSVLELCASIATEPPRELAPLLEARRSDLDGDVLRGLSAVVASCLEKQPKDRCPDVATLALGLEPFATEEGRASARRVARISGRSRSTTPGPQSVPPRSSGSNATPARISAHDPATASTLAATSGAGALRPRPASALRWAAAAVAIGAAIFAATELVSWRGKNQASNAPASPPDATPAPTTAETSAVTVTAVTVAPTTTETPAASAQATVPSARVAQSVAHPGDTTAKKPVAPTAPSSPTATSNVFHQNGLSDRH